ncbi:hypothetical protein AMK25_00080 [Micromonospora sp. TSRI0369]|uniref:hypothetical protein n=1 Tax=Micromonospora sp. TSRI0369 TaxID=1703936 RepID=UPI000939A133|nr:hypothetical protein [Micromonospora sp. TSRI0369]OKJ47077.1 hypothetical protein AMK25_00080 [Micromonospora sp. TSRI0369]
MRRVLALLGIPLLALSACATPGAAPVRTPPTGPDQRPAFTERAEEVAAGWRPGPGWRDGYVPLQDATVLSSDPGFTDETKVAFGAGWYRDQIPIPAAVPTDGTIRFPDGTLRVPLMSAADAYAQLRQGDPPPCDGRPAAPEPAATGRPGPNDPVSTSAPTPCVPLTVTEVRLGSAPVLTSRGRAEVPAWLFTVDELAVPVARIAVAPRVTGRAPGGAVPAQPLPAGLVSAQQLRAVEGNRIDYVLGVGACDGPPTPLVLERPDVVVIGGAVVTSTGTCTAQLVLKPVSVTLDAPLGGRAVLDAASGAPLTVRPG